MNGVFLTQVLINKKFYLEDKYRYPLSEAIPQESLDQEVQELEKLKTKPLIPRLGGYLKLGGPGFMGAALTLGAGTLTASMLTGAEFGYKTMWIYWVAMGSGLFMMAAMARFTCYGKESIINLQNKFHSRIVGSLMTALVGTAFVAIIFNTGQYSLGTNIIESLTPLIGFQFPRSYNWIIYLLLTSWLILNYGKSKKGTHLVESFMKVSIGIMLLCFGATLLVVGVDWKAALRGIFIPWLPSGGRGIDLFIASFSASIGVLDWIFFHYTGLARGWGPKHESLARSDFVMGLFVPFIIINYLVITVFTQTLFGVESLPETAQELSAALVPLLGETWSQLMFYIGFLLVPVSTTVGMSIACAIAIHEAFGWKPDTSSLRWKVTALLPQIGLLGVWYPNPVWLIIIIAAFLSLTNNIVGWSIYLLLNDKRVLGESRVKSYFWNLGVLVQITLLNAVAILYVLNRMGLWF